MEIVLSNPKSKYSEIISLRKLENINETLKKLYLNKGPIEANIFVINDSISSHQLSKFKHVFQ